MYSGDEFYGDEITSGPAIDDPSFADDEPLDILERQDGCFDSLGAADIW